MGMIIPGKCTDLPKSSETDASILVHKDQCPGLHTSDADYGVAPRYEPYGYPGLDLTLMGDFWVLPLQQVFPNKPIRIDCSAGRGTGWKDIPYGEIRLEFDEFRGHLATKTSEGDT